LSKNGDQDDDGTKARVQNHGIQQSVGPNHEHHSVLHAARPLPSITWQLRHCDEQGQENNGGRTTNVAEQDVNRGPDGSMGNKPMVQQTWVALQAYFTKKWLEHKQYSTTKAKQLRFKEAALLAQEKAAAEEEGESQAMLFAMLHKQSTTRLQQ
jgi:hypothetical protein